MVLILTKFLQTPTLLRNKGMLNIVLSSWSSTKWGWLGEDDRKILYSSFLLRCMYLYLDVCTSSSSTVQHRPTVRPVLGCVVLTVVVRIQEGLRREAKWSWDGEAW